MFARAFLLKVYHHHNSRSLERLLTPATIVFILFWVWKELAVTHPVGGKQIFEVGYTPRRTRGAGGTDVRVLIPSRRVKVRTDGRNGENTGNGDTKAQTWNMLSKERSMDCIMHISRLRDEIICLEARHDLEMR